MIEYAGIVVCLLMAGGVGAVFIAGATWLGPKSPSAVKSEPFECGVTPFTRPSGRFRVQFYLTAILFILFDVELVFLYPWAVECRRLGAAGLVEMGVFLAILMTGFFYVWDSGALEWD